MTKYQHLKSGRFYYVLSDNVINATNVQDGQRMVCYIGDRKDNNDCGVFVREFNEFHNKFRKV